MLRVEEIIITKDTTQLDVNPIPKPNSARNTRHVVGLNRLTQHVEPKLEIQFYTKLVSTVGLG